MKRTIETPFHHKRFDGIRLENTQPITAGFHSIIIKENDTSDDSRGITQPFFTGLEITAGQRTMSGQK